MVFTLGLAPGVHGDAEFSDDGRYRYWLERRWDASLPHLTYVLLNPSRAGVAHDDPTVRKLIALTSANGGGGFELVNLFAVMDTAQDSLHLPSAIEARAGENDRWIERVATRSETLIVGWGDGNVDNPNARSRRAAVRARADTVLPVLADRPLWYFRTIRSGAPGHPGRLRNSSPLLPFVRPHGQP